MANKIQIKTGDRFGKLTVVGEVESYYSPKGFKLRRFLCKCDCGKDRVVYIGKLSEYSACIDCSKDYRRPKSDKDFLKDIYYGMKRRTRVKESYIRKDIQVCQEWEEDMYAFIEWALSNGYQQGLTIDRIDNKGDYCPTNCRWTNCKQQARNTDRTHFIEVVGETHCITEWPEIQGIPRWQIYENLKKGATPAQAVGLEPFKKVNKRDRIVEQYDVHGNMLNVYLCIADAAKDNNVGNSSISAACTGRIKVLKGKVYKYAN